MCQDLGVDTTTFIGIGVALVGLIAFASCALLAFALRERKSRRRDEDADDE